MKENTFVEKIKHRVTAEESEVQVFEICMYGGSQLIPVINP
jgi:hypothetical protein